MVRILSNEDLEAVCTASDCIDAMYEGLKAYAQGNAARRPRMDLFVPASRPEEWGCFSTMDGVIRGGYYALRIKPDIMSWPLINGIPRRVTYCSRPGMYGGLILLFNTENAELVAIMNDGYVQHMRVGAISAIGVRYLAREDASSLGILGSGGMARSFALCYSAVRPIKTIKVYSPTKEHLLTYCREMSEKLQAEVLPVDGVEAAMRGSDIVAGCTNSMEPVLMGRWLEPGSHVDNVTGWEVDDEVYQRVTVVGHLLERESLKLNGYSDDNFDVRMSVMSYLSGQPEERDHIPVASPERPRGYAAARSGMCVNWETGGPGVERSREDVTTMVPFAGFNMGMASGGVQGIQFAAVAARAYELAAAKGKGHELPLEWFLQDTPT